VLTNTRRGRRRADTRSGSPISVFTFTRSGALRFRSKESAQRSPRRASVSAVVPQRRSGKHPSAWSPPVDRLRLASQSVRQHLRALPNPSLGTDPLRRASLPVWRAGLCCTTRASRPASAVGVSSNVRPRKPNAKTATPSRFGARSVIEQLHQRSLSGIAQSCKDAREQSDARDAPPRSEERPGGRSNQ
jgi:hypothetical protein